MSKNNSWQKYEIYLTFSKRLHLQSLIFISDTKRASKHRNLDGSSHFFLFERWRYRLEEKPKSLRVKRGRKSFFTPEGKVALAFLKMYTGLSAPKLMDALNGNIHYQIFCGIRISPENQLTNYKLIDSILVELSKKLKI